MKRFILFVLLTPMIVNSCQKSATSGSDLLNGAKAPARDLCYGLLITLVFLYCCGLPVYAQTDSLLAQSEQQQLQRDAVVLESLAETESNCDPETGFPWGKHTQPKGYHSQFDPGTKVRPIRAATDYAVRLLLSPKPEHQKKGNAILEHVLSLQDQNPESKTFGIWSWYYEEPLSQMAEPDFNWADFQGAILATILHDFPERLTPEVREKTEKSLEYCARAIIKRDVGPAYTNIAMMGATVVAAAGELLNRPDFLDYGRLRIKRNLEHYQKTGGFTEYNSPSYTTIVVRELERMISLVHDPECRDTAEQLRFFAWQTIAEHYHVPTGQWSGPHSRNYDDTLSEKTRNLILDQADVVSSKSETVASFLIPQLACPESLRHYFREIPPKEGVERHHPFTIAQFPREENGTTWMNDVATLGSASYHTFWSQTRGLIGYWTLPASSKPAALKVRVLHDGNDFASGCARNRQVGPRVLTAFGFLKNWGSMHPSFDRPQDGVFTAKSFEIVYQLTAENATARQLDDHLYELSAGPVRAALHIGDKCEFDGSPVAWKIRQKNNVAELVGICYQGAPKPFAVREMGEIRIAVGLELLQNDEKPSESPVMIQDVPLPKNQKVPFYGVAWDPVFDNVSNETNDSTLDNTAFPDNHDAAKKMIGKNKTGKENKRDDALLLAPAKAMNR